MMTKVYRTADDVAEMEAELHELRMRLEQTSRNLEMMTADRDRLQIENTMLDARARDMLVKSTRVENLLSNVAAMMVTGIQEFKNERAQARAVRRQEQETVIAAENEEDPPPSFLRREAPRRALENEASAYRGDREEPQPPRKPRSLGITETEGQRWRAEALVGAAERIAPRPVVTGKVNPAIADRDPRLPQNEFRTPQQQDDDNLRDIADNMQRRS